MSGTDEKRINNKRNIITTRYSFVTEDLVGYNEQSVEREREAYPENPSSSTRV